MKVIDYRSSQMQSMFDVALQHYGDLQEGLRFLLTDNQTIIDNNGKLLHGAASLRIRDETVNDRVLDYLTGRSIIPVTEPGDFHKLTGIDPTGTGANGTDTDDDNTPADTDTDDTIDQTFANTDLTFDGDHVHDLDGHTMRIRNGQAVIEGDLIIDGDGRGIIFREDGQDYRLRTERTPNGTYMVLDKI